MQEEVTEILPLDGGVVISLVTWFPMMPCPGFYFYFCVHVCDCFSVYALQVCECPQRLEEGTRSPET